MYVFDYGAPIGFRIALKHPEKILGIVSQNGNVYEEGLGPKWAARAEYWKNLTKELRWTMKIAVCDDKKDIARLIPLMVANILCFVFVKPKEKALSFLYFLPSVICLTVVLSYWIPSFR